MQKLEINAQRALTDKLYFANKFLGFTPREDQKSVLLDQADRKLVRAGRRWGKDTMIICGDVIPCMFTIPNFKIGMFGPGWEEIDSVMEILHEWVDDSPLLSSIKRPYNKREIKLTNGSSLIARVASPTSRGKRGRGFDLLVWVEAPFIADKVVASIRATRLIGSAREWVSGTPFGHNHFYRSESSGIYKCWHYTSYDNPLIKKKEIDKEKELMTDLEFKQEYMAEYIDDSTAPFPHELVEKYYSGKNLSLITDPEIDKDTGLVKNYYGGLDLGRRRDKSVLYVIEHIQPNLYIKYIWECNYDPKDPRFWDKVINHACFICKHFQLKSLWIDQSGIGDKPVADIKNFIRDNNIQTQIVGIDFSYAVRNKWEGLINSLCLRFERYQIHGPFIRELVRQLGSIRFDAKLKRFASYGKSPDHVVSLALASASVPSTDIYSFYSKGNLAGDPGDKTMQAKSYP